MQSATAQCSGGYGKALNVLHLFVLRTCGSNLLNRLIDTYPSILEDHTIIQILGLTLHAVKIGLNVD